MHFSNWFEYYDTLPASSALNMGEMEQMLKSFDAYLSVTESCAIMAKNKDLVFLSRTGLNKALCLSHRLEVSGGTVVSPEEECAFYFGIESKQ